MSASQFTKAVIDGDNLIVTGPFNPQGELQGVALIHVIVDQRPEGSSGPGPRSHGDTSWDQVINKGQDWTVTIARNGIQPGKARGIGGALVVKIKNTPDMKEIDPPAIETVTWCEPITVEGGGSAA